ncbi:MAG: hypothetical protein HXM47_00140 [Pseudoleptotrichia goodfellowii]|nr:hypothetical protein [Pseudoleptotrichia goodfellowii]
MISALNSIYNLEKRKRIIDVYKKTQNFNKTVNLTEMPIPVVFYILRSQNLLTSLDKINYGSESAMLGGEAEKMFQKLVPEAIDANRYIRVNNPEYDFLYKDLTIDVKYSGKLIRKNTQYWNVRTDGKQDIIVIFLERERGSKIKNPCILFIPTMFITTKSHITVSENGKYFKNFLVGPEDLEQLLDEYAELREKGMF